MSVRSRLKGKAAHVKPDGTVDLLVTLEIPHEVSLTRMMAYVRDEVKCNVGQLPPEDPLFLLNRASVRVRAIKPGEIK